MSADALGQIKAITKKDQIVTAIKNAILAGKLESGEPIIENRLAWPGSWMLGLRWCAKL